MIFICPKCNFEIANSRDKHVNTCNGEGPRRKRPKPGCKGIPKSQSHKDKISKSLIGKTPGIASTIEKEIERKQKISATRKLRGYGGYIPGSGRGKQGRYKGIWCDSSWELAWVIYHLDHDIKFERNTEKFEYQFDGAKHLYTPDFKINDNYIEIKGFRTVQVNEKINQFTKNLIVLEERELTPILKYVIEKYGKDYIRLYESRRAG
jgi:hypothetical protein